MRDFDINESWTRRFTDLIDKHVKFKDAKNIFYINAGTGDHCIAIREKVDDKIQMFATCENDELLKIARDKSVAIGTSIEFAEDDPDDDSFDAVVVDASFNRSAELNDLIAEAVRVARPGGSVGVVLPSAGSFGEVFSLLWEVLFNEKLSEHTVAVETMIADIPTVSKVEEFAEHAGLRDIKTESATEIFEYENGAEFVASPLVSDFLLPVWLDMLDEETAENVKGKLAQLIDEEDADLTFRFTVKVTLITGKKEISH